jgi:hypothetical protein
MVYAEQSPLRNRLVSQQQAVGGRVLKQTAIVCALAGALSAQGASAQFHLSPGFGVIIPHGSPLINEAGNASRSEVRKQMVGGPVFSTRAGWALSRLAGLEASLSYSPALIAVHSGNGRVDDRTGGLVLASARGVILLTPQSSTKFSLHAASGLGMVYRTGSGWSDTPAKPAFAIVLSGGLRVPFSPRSGLAFRADLEDYLSWAQFELQDGTRSRARPYHDLLWSLGLAIPLWGGSRR